MKKTRHLTKARKKMLVQLMVFQLLFDTTKCMTWGYESHPTQEEMILFLDFNSQNLKDVMYLFFYWR